MDKEKIIKNIENELKKSIFFGLFKIDWFSKIKDLEYLEQFYLKIKKDNEKNAGISDLKKKEMSEVNNSILFDLQNIHSNILKKQEEKYIDGNNSEQILNQLT